MQSEIGRLRKKFQESRAELLKLDAASIPCREFLSRHAALVDGLVSDIYRDSCDFAGRQAKPSKHSGFAIVATGGYGRGELKPFSDIDIAFIPSEEEDPWVEAAVHMAFKLVMDVFLSFREVRVGYAYRPVAELPTWDLPTLTALLDARHICGSPELSQALATELRKRLSPLELLLELESERARRRPGSGSPSLYAVEPNLKEGPGSLRDLHRGRWIFQLLLPHTDEAILSALEKGGYLSPSRVADVQAASEWFWRARNWLHLVTGKRSDILINNYQDRIAQDLGGETAQEWLSRHYAHAENLYGFRETAVYTVLQGSVELGGVTLSNGVLRQSKRAGTSFPGSAVKVFQLSQRYGIPLSFKQMERLRNSRATALRVPRPEPEECWSFLSILREGRRTASALRSLASAGLLDRFVEGFTALMRFTPPDPAHCYTVGEHSLKIIEHLETLLHGCDSTEPRFSELVSQCAHFDMLCLAALLHDAGKMLSGTDHSESGMELATSTALQLGLPQEKRAVLDVLVRHHLLLVRTARLQDLKSPGVIQAVADKVRGIDALRHLYVFTYADTKAVAEKNWTSMDFRDMEELYGKVQSLLSGTGGEGGSPVAIEDRLGQIRRKLVSSQTMEDEGAVHRHCDSMPASYVLNTPIDEITFHLQLLKRLDAERIVLDIYNRPGDDYSELTVCTHDDPQPGMLAKITGVLYACDSDIHKAQVFTLEKEDPVVLDTLWVRSGGMQLSENRAARVRAGLKHVLSGSKPIDDFLRGAGKQAPESIVLDSIDLRNDLSEEHTVVHIIARDLQGLLYLMTRTLSRSGLHIHSARVATWNARAENNFYVTTLAGGQIPDADLDPWKEQLTARFCGVTAGR